LALLSGHAFGPRNGVIQLLPGANSQGLADLGIKPRAELVKGIADGKIKGLFIFGEEVTDIDLSGLEFLAVSDMTMTTAAKNAKVVFPCPAPTEVSGTYTSADGSSRDVVQVIKRDCGMTNVKLAKELALAMGESLPDYTPPTLSCADEPCLSVPEHRTLYRKTPDTNIVSLNLKAFAEINSIR
jgi:formate dehydrogenase major subunit